MPLYLKSIKAFFIKTTQLKMKFLFTISLFISTLLSYSQTIVNLILVGENGVTEDITKAKIFIVIKKYPTNFQRLDYKLHGPLIKSKTYSESTR